jgi:hypothetical protein
MQNSTKRTPQMTTSLNALVANEHAAELRRAAASRRAKRSAKPGSDTTSKAVVLRLAESDDAFALHMLAELDEEPAFNGEALLALVDGEAIAAISLEDGRVVSNPFVATSNAVALLKLHAREMFGAKPRRAQRRWRPRFA